MSLLIKAKKFLKFWFYPILLFFTSIITIIILSSFNVVKIDSYTNFFFICVCFLIFLVIPKLEKWKSLNNNQRKLNEKQLSDIACNEVFANSFYYNRSKILLNILFLSLCLYFLFSLKISDEITILGVEILLINFIYLEIRKVIFNSPVIKFSQNIIWIKDIGFILMDEIKDIQNRKTMSRQFPFTDRHYLDIYLKDSKYSRGDYSIYLNELKNYKNIYPLLNPNISN